MAVAVPITEPAGAQHQVRGGERRLPGQACWMVVNREGNCWAASQRRCGCSLKPPRGRPDLHIQAGAVPLAGLGLAW